MNRPFWITLTVSATVCASAVMWQTERARSLAERLADERVETISKRTKDRPDPSTQSPETSEENIERALAAILALQPNVTEISPILAKDKLDTDDQLKIDYNGIEAAYLEIFPDFLRSVEGLTVEELIAVAKGIPDPKTKGRLGRPSTRRWLLLLAAEQDPMRIYRDEALMSGISDSEILHLVGREDPAAVLRRLPPMEKQTSEPSSSGIRMTSLGSDWALAARIRSGTRLLGTDLEQGLKVLSEVHENYLYIPPGISGTLGNTPLPEGAIPGLIDAMGRPAYAEMRDDLIEMILRDTVFDDGVAAAARQVETMDITEGELNTALDQMIRNNIMEGEPEAMIDWMSGVRPNRVPSLVGTWAETDLPGATSWLGRQEPSPVRDRAIAEFARTTASFDREGATSWARQIQDENMRAQTLRQVENR